LFLDRIIIILLLILIIINSLNFSKKKFENYKKINFKVSPFTSSTKKIVTSDSNGNLDTSLIDDITSSGIKINNWGIYQDSSKNLCFIRTDIDNTEPICFNGNLLSNGGGYISSPRNSIKAWVSFSSTSFVDGNDLGNYPNKTNVTKILNKKSSGDTDPGWSDAFNISKIERICSGYDNNRPDKYKIYFSTPMKDDKYGVSLGQGDPNGLPNQSWQNLLGVINKTTEYVEIYIKGDHPNGFIVAPWYDTGRKFLMSIMIYQ